MNLGVELVTKGTRPLYRVEEEWIVAPDIRDGSRDDGFSAREDQSGHVGETA